MKRSLLISTIVLLGLLFVSQTMAQTVKIKREAMTPTRIKGLSYLGISNPISSGLRIVGKGTRVYVSADTTGTVTSFAWTFVEKPQGSQAVIDSADKKFATFTADAAGRYIIQVTANGSLTHKDTITAQTYMGVGGSGIDCKTCHTQNYQNWQKTAHANIFKEGVTGLLEVEAGKGAYASGCIRCHTTGYDTKADNGNFGFLTSKVTSAGSGFVAFDTTWYKPDGPSSILELRNGDYWTTSGNTKAWDYLVKNYSAAVPLATIGCESCHGPGKEHMADKSKIAKSYDAGVCNQCHDAMSHHRLGYDYNSSSHAVWVDGSHTGQIGCYPCHSGSAFAKWVETGKNVSSTTGKDASGKVVWDASDSNVALSCAACHDPHGNGNEMQLRTVSVDTLKNGYKITSGGKGQLCMNCHRSRYAQKVTNTAPLYGYADRFNPHHSNQADMLFGQNAYEFGKPMAGKTTHTQLEDACVTCHMQARSDVGLTIANHSWSMTSTDSKGVTTDLVMVCQNCHGKSITKFDDIKGEDYDGDGVVNGVQVEVANLVARLKAVLPKDATGEVISMKADSAKILNKKNLVAGVYDYWFVMNDGSMGVHNTKYTVALLQNALATITGVEFKNSSKPSTFNLSQNYPNPFNPTTQIEFSVPQSAHVKLNVYNAVGQLINTLSDGEVVTGNYKVTWNGKDNSGATVASGVYLYRLEVSGMKGQNDFAITKKMVFAK